MIVKHIDAPEICCDEIWEDAYNRFETPEQEIFKFTKRLRRLGSDDIDRDARVIELFCGRGNGLVALSRMGFGNVEGVDLSLSLLQQYRGNSTLHLADCRQLPFDNESVDLAIVQGGLHHLPSLPDDLKSCFAETARVLRPQGQFWIVEPWMTPFLKWAHRITDHPIVRRCYARGDALATMTEREAKTYYRWLGCGDEILKTLNQQFVTRRQRIAWGKWEWVGMAKQRISASNHADNLKAAPEKFAD
ncbi:MAG: class I SAM-dependent methyltransferase [Planctomycetota bacterium]